MSTDKANYGGGNKGSGLHSGLKTHSPPVDDKSRAPIGSKHPTTDSGANRSEPSKQSPTLGPRTA